MITLLIIPLYYSSKEVLEEQTSSNTEKKVSHYTFDEVNLRAIYTNLPLSQSQISFKKQRQKISALNSHKERILFLDFSKDNRVLVSCTNYHEDQKKIRNILIERMPDDDIFQLIDTGVDYCLSHIEEATVGPDRVLTMLNKSGVMAYNVTMGLTKRTDSILFFIESFNSEKKKIMDFSCSAELKLGNGVTSLRCLKGAINEASSLKHDPKAVSDLESRYGFGFIFQTKELSKHWLTRPVAYRDNHIICTDGFGCILTK